MNIFTRKNDDNLLKYLKIKELQDILPIQEILEFEDESFVFSRNEKGKDIFLVLEGELIVFDKVSEDKMIDKISEGEIVGEVNLFLSPRRFFSVKAKGRTKVIRYPHHKLSQIMKKNPLIAAKINAAINDSLVEKIIKITQKL